MFELLQNQPAGQTSASSGDCTSLPVLSEGARHKWQRSLSPISKNFCLTLSFLFELFDICSAMNNSHTTTQSSQLNIARDCICVATRTLPRQGLYGASTGLVLLDSSLGLVLGKVFQKGLVSLFLCYTEEEIAKKAYAALGESTFFPAVLVYSQK